MPRLIEIDKKQEKRVSHEKCGAIIGYYQTEVKDGGIHHDYGGGSEKLYYITCPNCREKIYVKGY